MDSYNYPHTIMQYTDPKTGEWHTQRSTGITLYADIPWLLYDGIVKSYRTNDAWSVVRGRWSL